MGDLTPLLTLSDIMNRNQQIGHNWFSADTMQFFSSRVDDSVYPVPATGGAFFVTSDRTGRNCPRRYTVRYAAQDGQISTVGEFQQHATGASAHHAARVAQAEAAAGRWHPGGDASCYVPAYPPSE